MAKRSMPEKVLDTPEVKTEEVVIEPVEVIAPKIVTGIVSGCKKLNVRNKPSKAAEVKTEVSANTELEIDLEKSVDGWYKVSTESGATGYCMVQFVTVK